MKKSCGNCANRIEGADRFSKPCSNCVAAILDNGEVTDPSHWKPKPMTNADRIRAMTDEELAVALAEGCEERDNCYGCFAYKDRGDCPGESISAWIKWLQAPAEGE